MKETAKQLRAPLDRRARTDPDRLAKLRNELGIVPEDEAASILGKQRRTLRDWRQKDYGPPVVKIGRDPYYRISDLQAFIAGADAGYGHRGQA